MSKEDVEKFRTTGAIRIPNVIQPGAIEKLKTLADELSSLRGDETYFRSPTMHVRRGGTSFCEFVSREFSWIRDMVDYTRLAAIAHQLSESREIFFWRDELFSKDSADFGNATPWHHDVGALPFKGTKLVVFWIALTDVDELSAPLRTINSSNQRRVYYRPPLRNSGRPILNGYHPVPDFDRLIADGAVTDTVWLLAAGDAIAFEGYTVHGSLPNRSGTIRHAFVTRWLGDDVQWAPDAYSLADNSVDASTMLKNGRPVEPHFERYAFDGREPILRA